MIMLLRILKQFLYLATLSCVSLLLLSTIFISGANGWPHQPQTQSSFTSPETNPVNLIKNAGFESGSGYIPDSWTAFPFGAPGVTYRWENGYSNSGSRCVSIEVSGTGFGMAQQVVDIIPEKVYEIHAYVAFENLSSNTECNMQLLFRNESGQRVGDRVDFKSHSNGSREFAIDFPVNIKVRAPKNAATVEVNLYIRGTGKVYFDDIYFGIAPVGTITGNVKNGTTNLLNAYVVIHGDIWGKIYETWTDYNGNFTFQNVPVAFPRYILQASKEGYKTQAVGRIDVVANSSVTAYFDLPSGNDPLDDLNIKYGTLTFTPGSALVQIPVDAVIPTSSAGYPESIRPFLQGDEYINSNHPSVVWLAQRIMSRIPYNQQSYLENVINAFLDWNMHSTEHGSVFTSSSPGDSPFMDPTSGIYQTILSGGWCFGKNFNDWLYRPEELIDTHCGICIEHSRLACAILRYLNIPCRSYSGAMEFWVQPISGDGFWASIGPSGVRVGFRDFGRDGAVFGAGLTFPSVTTYPSIQQDFNCENEVLWNERHPWGESYPATTEDYNDAVADLAEFAQSGNAASGSFVPPTNDKYQIHYMDTTINLYNIGDQRILDVRFPMPSVSTVCESTGNEAYWTNHPECVVETYIEEITNPPVEGVEKWFHVVFDLNPLLP